MEKTATNGNGKSKDGLIVCQTSLGVEIRGTLIKLTRFMAVFEIYNPTNGLRASEVLSDFRITVNEHTIYSGHATVRHLMNMGQVLVCEATLNENSWADVEFDPAARQDGNLRGKFGEFLQEWQKLYKVLPEYKVIIADMQSFLADLRTWLDQIELGIRSAPAGNRLQIEGEVADELALSIIPCINEFFERFERVAIHLEKDTIGTHENFMRRQLHPFVLSAPFAYRTFHKPLGYAGDYEMVNMIARNSYEGGSLFAKLVNAWFLRQPPAQAHRNRIDYLKQHLVGETLRLISAGRPVRILNLACGPAQEVQKFLADCHICDGAVLTLVDFNEETLQHVQTVLEEIKKRRSRETQILYSKKSVQHILKESGRTIDRRADQQYDFIYCAGLFDYLSDQICLRLTNVMYEWLAPGGLLLTTNVEPSNPLRHGMEHLLDWHLMYRTGPQLREIAPTRADPDSCRVQSDPTGVNVFLEVRKRPGHD